MVSSVRGVAPEPGMPDTAMRRRFDAGTCLYLSVALI